MATVKMFKGSIIADIFDSPETIAQAQKDGYLLVEEKPKEPKKVEKVAEGDEEKPTVKKTSRQ